MGKLFPSRRKKHKKTLGSHGFKPKFYSSCIQLKRTCWISLRNGVNTANVALRRVVPGMHQSLVIYFHNAMEVLKFMKASCAELAKQALVDLVDLVMPLAAILRRRNQTCIPVHLCHLRRLWEALMKQVAQIFLQGAILFSQLQLQLYPQDLQPALQAQALKVCMASGLATSHNRMVSMENLLKIRVSWQNLMGFSEKVLDIRCEHGMMS